MEGGRSVIEGRLIMSSHRLQNFFLPKERVKSSAKCVTRWQSHAVFCMPYIALLPWVQTSLFKEAEIVSNKSKGIFLANNFGKIGDRLLLCVKVYHLRQFSVNKARWETSKFQEFLWITENRQSSCSSEMWCSILKTKNKYHFLWNCFKFYSRVAQISHF